MIDHPSSEIILGINFLTKNDLYIRNLQGTLSNGTNICEKLFFPDSDPFSMCREMCFKHTFKQASKITTRRLRRARKYFRKCRRGKHKPTRRRIAQLRRLKLLMGLLKDYRRRKSNFQEKHREIHETRLKRRKSGGNPQGKLAPTNISEMPENDITGVHNPRTFTILFQTNFQSCW